MLLPDTVLRPRLPPALARLTFQPVLQTHPMDTASSCTTLANRCLSHFKPTASLLLFGLVTSVRDTSFSALCSRSPLVSVAHLVCLSTLMDVYLAQILSLSLSAPFSALDWTPQLAPVYAMMVSQHLLRVRAAGLAATFPLRAALPLVNVFNFTTLTSLGA